MNKMNTDDLLRGSAFRPFSAQTIPPDIIMDLFEMGQPDARARPGGHH